MNKSTNNECGKKEEEDDDVEDVGRGEENKGTELSEMNYKLYAVYNNP